MILMHDKTYRKRLEQIDYLTRELEYYKNKSEINEDDRKDLIFQIEYYQRENKELRRKLKEYEK